MPATGAPGPYGAIVQSRAAMASAHVIVLALNPIAPKTDIALEKTGTRNSASWVGARNVFFVGNYCDKLITEGAEGRVCPRAARRRV